MKQHIKKFISLITTLAVTFTSIGITPVTISAGDTQSTDNSQNVSMSVENKAYVDVLLSEGITSATGFSNFQSDLTTELKKINVDTTYVNFITNKASSVDIKQGFDIFDWNFNSNYSHPDITTKAESEESGKSTPDADRSQKGSPSGSPIILSRDTLNKVLSYSGNVNQAFLTKGAYDSNKTYTSEDEIGYYVTSKLKDNYKWYSTVGMIGIVDGSTDLEVTGNQRYHGNMILSSSLSKLKDGTELDSSYEYEMSFDYSTVFGDSFYGTGVFLQTGTDSNNNATGIIIYFSNENMNTNGDTWRKDPAIKEGDIKNKAGTSNIDFYSSYVKNKSNKDKKVRTNYCTFAEEDPVVTVDDTDCELPTATAIKKSGVYTGCTILSDGQFKLGDKVEDIDIKTTANARTTEHLTITISSSTGIIKVNGKTLDGKYTGTSAVTKWGFLTHNYIHGCPNIGRFTFENLNINITQLKSFETILTEEQDNWTTGYDHVMVSISDVALNELTTSNIEYYDLINLMNSSSIHLLACGSDTSKDTYENYIKMLPNRFGTVEPETNAGLYAGNASTEYETCIENIAQYIKELIEQRSKQNTVVIDYPTSITINPSETAANNSWSIDQDIEQLKVAESNSYIELDNNLGYNDYSGSSGIAFPSGFTFDTPGIFDIGYDSDNVQTVIAHRLPVAIMQLDSRKLVSGTTYDYTFHSESFDLDSNDNETYGLGAGIKSLTWRYRVDGGGWIEVGKNSVIKNIDTTKETDVQLIVEDFLGATSVATISINSSTIPVAKFNFKQNPTSPYDKLNIIDSSYSPSGADITSYEWTITQIKDENGNDVNNKVWSGVTDKAGIPNFTMKEQGFDVGTYEVKLIVTDENGNVSYPYSQTLKVKDINYIATYNYNWGNSDRGYYIADEAKLSNYYTVDTNGGYPSDERISFGSVYPELVQPTKTVTATFDVEGGTIEGTSASTSSVSSTPKFKGWYLEETFTEQVIPKETEVTIQGSHDLYAKWEYETITLPEAYKDGEEFLYWVTDSRPGETFKAGIEYTLDEHTTFKAVYLATYYEGQIVTESDLLALIGVTKDNNGGSQVEDKDKKLENNTETGEQSTETVEDKNKTDEQSTQTSSDGTTTPSDETTSTETVETVGIKSITYNLGEEGKEQTVDYKSGTNLETSSAHIGNVKITYTNGQEVKECIAYNDLPSVTINSYTYAFNGDSNLDASTMNDLVINTYVTAVYDKQDTDKDSKCKSDDTASHVYVKSVHDILVDPAYAVEHSAEAEKISNISTLTDLYNLRNTNPDAFKAIEYYYVEVDTYDQFGKYASGDFTETAKDMGVTLTVDPADTDKKDQKQDIMERSILVICTNDSVYTSTYESIRYVNKEYLDTVDSNSYWGDTGKSILSAILSLRDKVIGKDSSVKSSDTTKKYTRSSDGSTFNINIHDYTKE